MSILKSTTPLGDYGYDVLKNGFSLIPVKQGTKQPAIPNWTNFKANPKHISRWMSNGKAGCEIGILTKYNPVLDLDIQDEDFVVDLMEVLTERYGRGIRKIGQSPKLAIIYRTDTPFDKISSPIYMSPDGKKNQLEILCNGQYTKTMGIHPTTGRYYTFLGKPDITNTLSDDLPLLTEQDAHDIIALFCEMVPSDWVVKSGSTVVHEQEGIDEVHEDELINLVPPCDLTTEEVIEYMTHIPADGYDSWVRMGVALWHQYGGNDEGFDLWNEWSQADVEGYHGQTRKKMMQKWGSYDWRKKKRRPVTFASIMKIVNDGLVDDIEPNILDKYLKRFALLPNDRIVDLEGHARSQKDFGGLSEKGIRYMLPEDTYRPPNSKKPHHMVDKWVNTRGKKMIAGFEYAIGSPQMFQAEGVDWMNMYLPPVFADTTEKDLLGQLFEHMEYLIPEPRDRELFWQWMAHRVQHPADRIKFVPLHISRHHGTGRGFIADFMARMVGMNNLQTAKMKEIAGEGQGQFNTFLNSAICVVHEVREKDKKFEVSDKVRDTLDGDYLKVTAKGRTAIMKKISCSFLMFSNHFDALALTDDDRRMWVIAGPHHIREEEYYTRLYKGLEDTDWLMQAYGYLKHYDLSTFNRAMRAPDYSGMRHKLISNSESNDDGVIQTLLEEKPFQIATRSQIIEWAGETFPDDPINSHALRKIVDTENCVNLHRLRWRGNTNAMPVALYGGLTTDNAFIRKELDRTEAYIALLKTGIDMDDDELI